MVGIASRVAELNVTFHKLHSKKMFISSPIWQAIHSM
jgi:hypothetical protein